MNCCTPEESSLSHNKNQVGNNSSSQGGTEKPKPDSGITIRSSHPRLFFTAEDLPTIKANAAGDYKAVYEAMKKRIDDLMATGISFPDPLVNSGEHNKNHEIGFRAADAAMVWLISGDKTYLEHAKVILREMIDYYQMRVDNNLNIAWYVYSQVCGLCAYDWIYNDLTADERKKFGNDLYKVMYDIAWHGSGVRASRYRENISDHTSGNYGINVLPWYLSLTFYGEGINDARCESMFKSGYDLHMKMAEFRREMAGTKGGGATACAVYSFGFYPHADFNFLYTYRSATGVDLSEQFDYVLKYLDYLDWVRLPGNQEYGFGDVHHYNCKLPHTDIHYHIAEIANLYGERHSHVLPLAARMLSQYSTARTVETFPFMRFLHKTKAKAGAGTAVSTLTKSQHFDTMGQVYMRSGVGDNDTYALFVSGGIPTNHKHYDNNHFVIYKNGYRVLDSGTRPEPGQHLFQYYCRTVAHNCVTVRMPNETFPKYWGNLAPGETQQPVPNDGGQRELLKSELKSLVETEDYVYLASDATEAYSADKVDLVMREFVYCPPDVFVVFDRVQSDKAEYPKTWLYHVADEPVILGKEFSEVSQGGKSICKTLYPQDAVIEKIGGPGKQFWSDGKNWPLPTDLAANTPSDTWPLVGQWRIEVKPGSARKLDYFMHIIQVGSPGLSSLPVATSYDDGTNIGVEFNYNNKKFKIDFAKTPRNNYGCKINVTK